MKFRVTFRKRFDQNGQPADDPVSTLDPGDGVIEDQEFIEILDPPSIHVADDINAGSGSENSEDDGFLAFGTETWVFDVAEGREDEFRHALAESGVVLMVEEVPDESLTT